MAHSFKHWVLSDVVLVLGEPVEQTVQLLLRQHAHPISQVHCVQKCTLVGIFLGFVDL